MQMLLPILIALAVAALTFAVVQMSMKLFSGDKRKLKLRLSAAAQDEFLTASSTTPMTITRQFEADGMTAVLLRFRSMQHLQRRLTQAFPERKLSQFLLVVVGLGFFTLLITFAISGSLLLTAIITAVALYLPFFVLSSKRAGRQHTLANQLPEALDFLSRILRAGHSLSTGLQMMSEELPQPLAGEFRRCYDQHSLGQSLDDALKDMATRVDSSDFAFFVTAVLIQRQTGGDLSEVLDNISGMIRQRIRLQQHVKAKTAEGRFTGYILVAFPAVMFVIMFWMAPENAQILIRERTGQILLGIAFSLQMLGLLAIRKITTVRV